jgi:hypothetical protein
MRAAGATEMISGWRRRPSGATRSFLTPRPSATCPRGRSGGFSSRALRCRRGRRWARTAKSGWKTSRRARPARHGTASTALTAARARRRARARQGQPAPSLRRAQGARPAGTTSTARSQAHHLPAAQPILPPGRRVARAGRSAAHRGYAGATPARSLTDPWLLGGRELRNRLVLAPLADIGNWFGRLLAKRLGAGLGVSELSTSTGVLAPGQLLAHSRTPSHASMLARTTADLYLRRGDPGAAIRRSCRARPAGFEPAASCSGGRRSIP